MMKLPYFTCPDKLLQKGYTVRRALVLSSGVLAVFLSSVSALRAYDNWGASAAASGRGGAQVAFAGDPTSIFYNPAGLAGIHQYLLYGMFNRQSRFGYTLEEKPYSFAAAGVLPFSKGVLAIGFIQRGAWSEPTQVVTHNTVALAFARLFSSSFALGINAKYLFNTNYGNKSGADFDLGAIIFATSRLAFGLAGENLLGTEVEPDDLGTYFFYNRRQVKLGLAYKLVSGEYHTSFGFDTIFKEKKGLVTDGNNLNNFGIEQHIPVGSHSSISLRVGYSLGKDYNQDFNSYAFGFSYELRGGRNLYRIDYSYQDYPFESSESFAGDNRIALTIAFGAPPNVNSLARGDKERGPAVVNIPEKKGIKTEISQVEQSADVKDSTRQADAQTKTDTDKSFSASKIREPEENKGITSQVAEGTFAGLVITSQVKGSQDETTDDKFYVFLFQYNFEEKLKSVAEWKILISTSTSDSFLTQGSDASILQTITGQGIPPTAVGWEGDDKNGKRVAPGKYFYAVYLRSNRGERFLSAWSPIMVE